MKTNSILIKGCKILLATLFIGVGVGVIIYGNVGSDTITVFQDGLHKILNISYGQASRLYNLVMIILACMLGRKYFGIGTIISALLTGYAIDFSNNFLIRLNLDLNYFQSIVVFVVGHFSYTFGLSILINCKLGMNALDSMLYKLKDVSKIDYRISRFIVDLLLTLFGYILGGVVGIGTIISVISTGTMINYFSKLPIFKERKY